MHSHICKCHSGVYLIDTCNSPQSNGPQDTNADICYLKEQRQLQLETDQCVLKESVVVHCEEMKSWISSFYPNNILLDQPNTCTL